MRVFLVKENVFIPAKVVNLCALIIFMFLQLILYFHMLLNCSTNGFLIISAEFFFVSFRDYTPETIQKKRIFL